MGPLRCALLLSLTWATSLFAMQPAVHGKAAVASAILPDARMALRATGYPRGFESVMALPALAPAAKATDASDDKRMRIGVARDALEAAGAAPRNLAWIGTDDGGRAARMRVTSPGAAAMRVGLRVHGLPQGAQLRVAGADERAATAPVDAVAIEGAMRAQGIYWTPVTEGDEQVVEIWLPRGASSEPSLAVTTVSHLLGAPSHLFKSTGPGTSQSCEENVACVAGRNPALARAANAVAKLLYTESGVSYLCTGTLLNDGDPQSEVPYMLTAAHCVGSDAAAATLNTFWFFQSASCGGKDASTYKQLAGGAKLLYANATTDVALVRLHDDAPAGAWFSGWDASALGRGTAVVALHHPSGDVKKVSLGQALDAIGSGAASFSTAAWSTGSTEGGSSGSGLFTFDGEEYVLRGGLRGGSASCTSSGRIDDPANRDYFSRLDLEGDTLAKWLAAGVTPRKDVSGLWYDPDEPGWGLSIAQGAEGQVFAAWFTYDAQARATWMVMPQATWQSPTVLEGALVRTEGSAWNASYDRTRFALAQAGELRIEFARDGTATATFTVDGQAVVKAIRRQPL
jgi:hypothetical protein